MICAVLLQNQAQDSVTHFAPNPAFSVAPIEFSLYGGPLLWWTTIRSVRLSAINYH